MSIATRFRRLALRTPAHSQVDLCRPQPRRRRRPRAAACARSTRCLRGRAQECGPRRIVSEWCSPALQFVLPVNDPKRTLHCSHIASLLPQREACASRPGPPSKAPPGSHAGIDERGRCFRAVLLFWAGVTPAHYRADLIFLVLKSDKAAYEQINSLWVVGRVRRGRPIPWIPLRSAEAFVRIQGGDWLANEWIDILFHLRAPCRSDAPSADQHGQGDSRESHPHRACFYHSLRGCYRPKADISGSDVNTFQ